MKTYQDLLNWLRANEEILDKDIAVWYNGNLLRAIEFLNIPGTDAVDGIVVLKLHVAAVTQP